MCPAGERRDANRELANPSALKAMTYCTLYKSKDGWRWRFIRGGRIVAHSGEGYSEKRKARQSLENLIDSVAKGALHMKGDQ